MDESNELLILDNSQILSRVHNEKMKKESYRVIPTYMPLTLFHYTSQKGLLGIVEKKKIWATSIHYLNDAKEFEYGIGLARKIFMNFKESVKKDDRIDELYFHIVEDSFTRFESLAKDVIVFVCCFSEEGNLLSQWRGYCRNYSGFSIGFDTSQLVKMAEKQSFSLKPCVYDEEDQEKFVVTMLYELSADYSSMVKSLSKDDLHSNAEKMMRNFFERFVPMCSTLKHPSFSEEHEWRLISRPFIGARREYRFREGTSMIIPYLEFGLVEENDKLLIKHTYIGPTPHEDLSTKSIEILLSSNDVESEKIEYSKIPYRGW